MNKITCRHCPYMEMFGRAQETKNNYGLKGPRGECLCKHPKAEETFHKVLPDSHRYPTFIDYTPPGEVYPALKTSPRWCPLRMKGGLEHE